MIMSDKLCAMIAIQGSHASWKVLELKTLKFQDLESPGKSLWSWKLKFKVLESPGKIVATRCHILRLKCTKFNSG